MRSFALIALVASVTGCSGDSLLHNSMVDRWCDDHPCSWDTVGEIERVPTWHEQDYAVALLSDDAALTQLNSISNSSTDRCFDFTMVAKLDASTKLFLELDFLDDGDVEFSQRIPESNWDRRTFLITPPTWYEGVRFTVRKEGPGDAAVAQLSARTSYACTKPPLELDGRPAGATCDRDGQCAIGHCDRGICASCRQDQECAAGELCGVVDRADGVLHDCVQPARSHFAARCERDDECSSGICCGGACSTCCNDEGQCASGEVCGLAVAARADNGVVTSAPRPHLCAPGERRRLSEEDCTDGSDCASGKCEGAEVQCSDQCSGAQCTFCVASRLIGGTCK